MNLHFYQSVRGTNPILEYIHSLSTDEKVDGLKVLSDLEKNNFDSLHIKVWEKKIYEVYFYKHNRIFYVTVDGSDIYLLHACRKQKNKTERKDKKIVESRARELGMILQKKFI